jgi:hypothetical protein
VDKILKGAKPGDLPVQARANQVRAGHQSQDSEARELQPSAKLLALADEVIE